MNDFRISVIIPVYNGSKYMREAIDSALDQSYPAFEVIVVNDGSGDGGKTRETALSYGDRIRYFEKENGGVSSALNLGIKNMRGDWFSWLSHDDVYCRDKLKSEVELLSKYQDKKLLAYCRCSTIDSESREINKKSKSDVLPAETVLEPSAVLHHLLRHGTMNGCCFLIPKGVFAECGEFDESLRYSQDTLMWYRIFCAGHSLVLTPGVGVKNRVHSAQQTVTASALYYKDSVYVCRQILPEFSALDSAKEESLVYSYALHHAVKGNREVVELCRAQLKADKHYSPARALRLSLSLCYGRVRPLLRKAYYRIFRKIKTR